MSSTQQKEHDTDATETRSDMMESIDKVIDELDRRSTKLKEESFKYKYGQPVERTVHFEKDGSNSETSHTERKLEGTYLDPKDMERDIKYDMRSTPKYTEEKIENDGYGHDGYEDRRIKDDARYRYSTDKFGSMDNRPLEDYRLREKPLHIRFVERYDRKKVDDPRQMTENINRRDKGAVPERDRRYDNVPYHGDMDSQREAAHHEGIDHLHQREKMIAEQERALAEKERVLERKRAILKQEAEAQRIKKSADLEEQEILERERRLQERLNRMKESERELEILEISLKKPSSLTLHEDRPPVVVSEKKERQKEVNKNSEETEKQHFQSQREIEMQMLKDGKKSLIDRRARILEDDISTTDCQKQATKEPTRDREERITLEKNMFFPKFTPFSGEDPKPKGEASYEEWRYEVNCIQRDKMYSKYVIGQAIRKSLRGQAKRVLLPMGVTATIEDIMDRLESVFGNVATGMSTLQEFFTSSQKEQETVAAWGLRLEEIMQRAIDKGQVRTEEKNNLLRDKFWRSLRSERLRSATKYEFRTVLDFEQLVKAVRTEELSIITNAKAQHQAVTTNVASAEQKTERAGTANQDLMTQTLRELQKGLKQFNKKRDYRYQWNPKQNQAGRGRQYGQQQRTQQSGGNQQQP